MRCAIWWPSDIASGGRDRARGYRGGRGGGRGRGASAEQRQSRHGTRRLPGAAIGASAHSAEEAAALLRAGGGLRRREPVFITASKPATAQHSASMVSHASSPRPPVRSWHSAGSPRRAPRRASPPARAGSPSWVRSCARSTRKQRSSTSCARCPAAAEASRRIFVVMIKLTGSKPFGVVVITSREEVQEV